MSLVEQLLATRTPLELAKELAELRAAVAALVKARGRYHTEQSYRALVDALEVKS